MLRQSLASILAALLVLQQGAFSWAQTVKVEVPVGSVATPATGGLGPVATPGFGPATNGPALGAATIQGASLVRPEAPLRAASAASRIAGGVARALSLGLPVSPLAGAAAPSAEPPEGQPAAVAPYAELPKADAPAAGDYTSEAIRRASQAGYGIARSLGVQPVSFDEPIDYPVEYPKDSPKSLAELDLTPTPGKTYTPSPEDWSDQAVYFPLIDRFAKGEGARPVGDPRNGRARHGGNLAGLVDKLDYIKNAGFTTILINPVFVNAPDGYHGYSPVDFLGVDPHLGTMADFKRLVDEAHRRGLYLIFDLAINHAGAVFEYKGDSNWEGLDKPKKEIGKWNFELNPSDLRDPKHFSRRGVLNDWNDPDQKVNADFPPYQRRLETSNPATQDALIKMAKWWIKETDVDGFRLDAYKHIAPEFWPRFHKEISEYAASLGKTNFLRPGEILTHDANEIAHAMGPDGINAAYNYPSYLRDVAPLQGRGPMRFLEESLKTTLSVLGSGVKKLFRFLDTQDTYRFLDDGSPQSALWVALSYAAFSAGIPLIYYGTEQALRQAHQGHYDPRNREDMFPDGQYKSDSSAGDKFDQDSPTYKYLTGLLKLRHDIPALRRGEQYVRWADQFGPGIYAFSRIYEGQEVLVVMNTAGEEREADMFVDAGISPAGTRFVDVMGGSTFAAATYDPQDGDSKIRVKVPPHGVRVLVHDSRLASAPPTGPPSN
ncbi:MAG: alpha-glucosidase C-terminal domain-containing protein [Elusimicrobia bacterium]|nr:alpha-glucosidase C-terminal domain-containing protein [Elusimicrobiota bacterium]